jgi:hypothetical protein
MLKTTVLFYLLFFSLALSAQRERTISGFVKSKADSIELLGASIRIKGTKKGAISNFNGRFRYSVKAKNLNTVILEVSFLGFKTQLIPLENKTYFEIYLDEDTNNLDEIIITSSYGTTKLKQEVVGSIVTIKAADLGVEQAVVSFDELLEGQIAGVSLETNPQLGGAVKIDIRGQGSITPLNGV